MEEENFFLLNPLQDACVFYQKPTLLNFFQNIYKDGFLMSFVVVVSNTPHDDFKESSFYGPQLKGNQSCGAKDRMGSGMGQSLHPWCP